MGQGEGHSYMNALQRGLGETAKDNSTAFGFSLTISGAGLIASDVQGAPAVGEVFMLIGGATVAMILLVALTTKEFRTTTAEDLPESTQLRGSALNFISVGAGLLAAWGLSAAIAGSVAWLATGFGAMLIYLVVEGSEYALALRAE